MRMEQNQLLENGEVILEKIRKHWIVYVKDGVMHVFTCFITLVMATYITSRGVLSFIDKDMGSYIGLILMMFVIIFWVSFFYAWTKEYFDVWYVTDKHIIAVNQKQMFEREEAFMELSRIQDVLFEKNGFLFAWLGYGKLKIQSAGIDQEFVIDNVTNVESFAHRILELRGLSKNTSDNDTL